MISPTEDFFQSSLIRSSLSHAFRTEAVLKIEILMLRIGEIRPLRICTPFQTYHHATTRSCSSFPCDKRSTRSVSRVPRLLTLQKMSRRYHLAWRLGWMIQPDHSLPLLLTTPPQLCLKPKKALCVDGER